MPAAQEEWTGEDVELAEVERELGRLRGADMDEDGEPDLRTSFMTHVAWIPPKWESAARQVLAGLDERYPSRTILLFPEGCPREDGLDASVSLRCFAVGSGRHVCTEIVELRLSGRRAQAPASLVMPLLLPDLPVFLRWRGRPLFGSRVFEQLIRVADRLVVDSSEWDGLQAAYRDHVGAFDQAVVSDIAWARTLEWRQALALRWPAIAEVRSLAVTGPRADALLLAGWLRSRLACDVELEHEEAAELEGVTVDGDPVDVPLDERRTASDLLSDELDRFTRDPVYEAAVRAAV